MEVIELSSPITLQVASVSVVTRAVDAQSPYAAGIEVPSPVSLQAALRSPIYLEVE